MRLNSGSFSTAAARRQRLASRLISRRDWCGGRRPPGGRGRRRSSASILACSSGVHRRLVAIRRQVVHRKIGAGLLRPRGRIGRQADAPANRRSTSSSRRAPAPTATARPPTTAFIVADPTSHPSRENPSAPCRWYEPCSDKTSNCIEFHRNRSNHCRPKRLKPEQAKPSGAASMCRNEEILSQCNTRLTRIPPARDRRGDEPEMKL